jgi:ornithine cyclodeaminase/alanine dehydrogenase-like protein (mu-crystallin family)
MLILSNEEIDQLLTMPACIAQLEKMYCDDAQGKTLVMPRVDNLVPSSHEGAYYAFKHMGGAWVSHKIMALRLNSDIITHPRVGNSARRVKVPAANGRWVGLVQLFSIETGELLAMFPDGVMQRMRVGAASGLALNFLARRNARRVGLLGSGWQAGAQLLAALATRPIEEIKVFSLRATSRETFAQEMRDRTKANIRAVESAEECVRDVDIILAATSSMSPVIRPEWLHPGMHASCIKLQEVDQSVLDKCDYVAVHNNRQASQIDNIFPGTPNVEAESQRGWWNQSNRIKELPSLSDLIAGAKPGRTDDQQITLFVNNTGLGLQFAALGEMVVQQARARKLGKEMPGEWFTQDVHP